MSSNDKEVLGGMRDVWVKNIKTGLCVFTQQFGMISFGRPYSSEHDAVVLLLEKRGYTYGEDTNGDCFKVTLDGDNLIVEPYNVMEELK